ncbi:MAG: accessory factor UbiK family protein [Gammaproteobacteria bacterium]|nr:accessory factor UbiK family protein [Gammaproteobacteria bacterium]
MEPTQFLKDLAERLSNALPENLQAIKKDCEKNMHSILTSAFTKLDLVTREEFDTQTKVLARTRKKVDALEATVLELQKSIQDQHHD